MTNADELIKKIIAGSQIPSGRRTQDVARELRAHVEDFVEAARQAGHTDEEVHRMVAANFGEPLEIAREFASLYRRERAILRISVFLLCTMVAGAGSASVALAIQAALSLGLGASGSNLIGARHMMMEALYILAMAAAYAGLISFEKLFDQRRLEKSVAAVAGCFAVIAVAAVWMTDRAEMLIVAFVSGVALRLIQAGLKNPVVRVSAVLACFGLLGVISACMVPGSGGASLRLAVWIAVGMCCYLMTQVAERVDRRFWQVGNLPG